MVPACPDAGRETDWGHVMRDRIRNLKDRLNARVEFNDWFILERIKMQSYKASAGKPLAIRRALMLRDLLEQMPISLDPDDLLAGMEDHVFATSYNLFKSGLENFDGYCGYGDLYEEVAGRFPKNEIEAVRDFWINDAFEQGMARNFTRPALNCMKEGVWFAEPVTGHVIYDAPTVLERGLSGILADVRRKLAECGSDAAKRRFYEAMEISLNAAIAFAGRYVKLAREMAEKIDDPKQRAGLRQLAQVLERVPANPATRFREAVQAFWLVYVIMHIEQTPNPYAFSVGRADQFLYPYYRYSIDNKLITQDDALELLEALWLKFNVGNRVWAVSQNLVIGGVTRDGKDATNELTYLCLDATEDVKVPLPTITVKCHSKMPDELLDRACEMASHGRGNPTMINDDVVIKSKMATGVSLEDARDSVIAGCQELLVQGAENARTTADWFSLPKCLELALNDGKSTTSGKQLGPATGKPIYLTSFDDVVRAFWTQVEYHFPISTEASNRCDHLLAELRPVPFISTIMKDCIEQGRDFRTDGARYNFSGFLCHGVANVADSLAAIRKLVFEKQEITMSQLAEALRTDFKDAEALRVRLIEGAPKYGNDDDSVDSLAAEIATRMTELVAKQKNAFGGMYRCGFSTPSTHVLYGMRCGATPDGRHKGDSFAYGIGPTQGYNKSGPTAVFKSCTKFEHWRATHGLAITASMPPQLAKPGTIKALVKSYFGMNGRFVHFNVQDVAVLREAQKHPEQHRDVIVRVHGMSAYFVNLDPLIQEDIISRTEHCV